MTSKSMEDGEKRAQRSNELTKQVKCSDDVQKATSVQNQPHVQSGKTFNISLRFFQPAPSTTREVGRLVPLNQVFIFILYNY